MRTQFLSVLKNKYSVEYDEHMLALDILMDKCVGISEHTSFIEEADKHISAMANAMEKQQVVEYLENGHNPVREI